MLPPPPIPPPVRPESDVFPGSELTADEVEFAQAMERYRRKRCRRFPGWSEVLQVLLSLGYRRVPKEPSPCSVSPASVPLSSPG